MKKIMIFSVVALLASVSCTNLDEEIYSQVPKDVFLADENNLNLYTARPYTCLQNWGAEQSMLTMIMQLTNEVAIPASYNGSWMEQRYGELQSHSIPTSNKLVRCAWDFCFDGIAACNDALYVLQNAKPSATNTKSQAEIKVLRAFYYLLAVDCWGNVPYSINKAETGYPVQKDRAFMLNFIETEVKNSLSVLDDEVSAATYGRITKDVAKFILAKIYLNSKEWVGKDRFAELETICDEIMKSGHFSLSTKYSDNFAINNENGSEAIFAIPYSNVYTPSSFYIYVMTFNEDLIKAYNIGEAWNGSMMCQPDFFDSYEAADTRKADTWLYGQVYDYKGQAYKYKSIVEGQTVEIPYILNPSPIDESCYKGRIGRLDGARIIKWPYQTDGVLKNYKVSMENDFYLMRYSDVVLMYVEALVRQGKTSNAVNVEEFKQIRQRAGLEPFTEAQLTLDNLLLERQHELCMEGWSRQDLIRFGQYTKKWWAKEAGKDTYKLLPIPEERRRDNPNLQQNPGY